MHLAHIAQFFSYAIGNPVGYRAIALRELAVRDPRRPDRAGAAVGERAARRVQRALHPDQPVLRALGDRPRGAGRRGGARRRGGGSSTGVRGPASRAQFARLLGASPETRRAAATARRSRRGPPLRGSSSWRGRADVVVGGTVTTTIPPLQVIGGLALRPPVGPYRVCRAARAIVAPPRYVRWCSARLRAPDPDRDSPRAAPRARAIAAATPRARARPRTENGLGPPRSPPRSRYTIQLMIARTLAQAQLGAQQPEAHARGDGRARGRDRAAARQRRDRLLPARLQAERRDAAQFRRLLLLARSRRRRRRRRRHRARARGRAVDEPVPPPAARRAWRAERARDGLAPAPLRRRDVVAAEPVRARARGSEDGDKQAAPARAADGAEAAARASSLPRRRPSPRQGMLFGASTSRRSCASTRRSRARSSACSDSTGRVRAPRSRAPTSRAPDPGRCVGLI